MLLVLCVQPSDMTMLLLLVFFFFQAEDGIRDLTVTGFQTCALPISSGHPRDGAVKIYQDVDLYATRLAGGQRLDHRSPSGRKLWLQVARGSVETEGDVLNAGDGAAWSDASSIRISAKQDAELLLFDMAPH